jgi:hypothetical protein
VSGRSQGTQGIDITLVKPILIQAIYRIIVGTHINPRGTVVEGVLKHGAIVLIFSFPINFHFHMRILQTAEIKAGAVDIRSLTVTVK